MFNKCEICGSTGAHHKHDELIICDNCNDALEEVSKQTAEQIKKPIKVKRLIARIIIGLLGTIFVLFALHCVWFATLGAPEPHELKGFWTIGRHSLGMMFTVLFGCALFGGALAILFKILEAAMDND